MADNLGIRVAYNAYITLAQNKGFNDLVLSGFNYTARQLFWIGAASAFCLKIDDKKFAQTMDRLLKGKHTPLNLRFNPLFQNMPEFSQDFQCKSKAPMNPPKKCTAF